MRRSWLILVILLTATPVLATEAADSTEADAPAEAKTVVREDQELKGRFTGEPATTFKLIGAEVKPGTRRNLQWYSPQAPGGFAVATPVIIVNGHEAGPVLCLTAAIHGDELNGIEIARRVVNSLDPKKLKGVVVSVPIVNLEGFWRRDRYIGDRRDLNRYFPGTPDGAYPGRVAYALMNDIVKHCHAVVDLHTGSFYRENLPQLRADLTVKQVANLAEGFGGLTVLHNTGPPGSLRGAATAAGVPTVVMEIGGPLSLDLKKVELGVKSLETLLDTIGMIDRARAWSNAQPVFYSSQFVRAEVGGILINKVKLGARIKTDTILAEIIDPINNAVFQVRSPMGGTVLGRAQNQFVSPGFAIFRIGHKKSKEELAQKAEAEKKARTEKRIEELGANEEMRDRKP
ncbi:MAG: succinylglutamate desuccinylase/aspartoacylase family protein [Desulfobacterales bacterium]|nr:succinylglutamate desuccinylase/aspartoacylase family protein [Desulfobacterales bacterium]MDJ0876199.1 succinylglutamate desuccinylase/aspartoacylase family protein [Desulfobacterales bacterium]MDJ0884288.1 succinylglutamate desuccinylase/aspartoacylase family protein [Desulfobacterales bacterium]